jgi:hypothetical protein
MLVVDAKPELSCITTTSLALLIQLMNAHMPWEMTLCIVFVHTVPSLVSLVIIAAEPGG